MLFKKIRKQILYLILKLTIAYIQRFMSYFFIIPRKENFLNERKIKIQQLKMCNLFLVRRWALFPAIILGVGGE